VAKQTTITIETKSLLVLHSRSSRRSWCPVCGSEVEIFVLEEAGMVSKPEYGAFERWLNSGKLHRIKDRDGSSLICLNSLLARVQNTKQLERGNSQLPNVNKEKT
jgi:hypothetical protein